MAKVYVFADEAGNFDFKIGQGASAYFILGTVTLRDLTLGAALLDLRRDLAWQGAALDTTFHATEDKQIVRDAVFGVLQAHEFRFDCTILDKRKTEPHLQADKERFYKMAWFLHFKYVAPYLASSQDEMLVVGVTIGEKKRRKAIRYAIGDVVSQSTRCTWEVAFWPALSDPCLLAADYCTWAVQRKYEKGDDRSPAGRSPCARGGLRRGGDT